MRKIAIIGTRGFERKSEEVSVDCFPWDRIGSIRNLRDYDVVLVSVLSVTPDTVDWPMFYQRLNPPAVREILWPGGEIVVIGDPRFKVKAQKNPAIRAVPFLSWTGAQFSWDNEPGDTMELGLDYASTPYKRYLSHLREWKYSLRHCNIDHTVLGQYLEKLTKSGRSLRICDIRFCRNRYGGGLAFRVLIDTHRKLDGQTEHSGAITFLPPTELDEREALSIILADVCGLDLEAPEPEWVSTLEPPGQNCIDDEIERITEQANSLQRQLEDAKAPRTLVRRCLKLLYERGDSLEQVVRETLRSLGADVEDPPVAGKEDGWLTVQVGRKTLEGVLEIKSTLKEQFNEDGLRQLLEWRNRGLIQRQKKYKSIFIGSSSVARPPEDRPNPFNDAWATSAELSEIVAVKAEDLYHLHCLNAQGKLDTDSFWALLFGTNGVLDLSELIEPEGPTRQEIE